MGVEELTGAGRARKQLRGVAPFTGSWAEPDWFAFPCQQRLIVWLGAPPAEPAEVAEEAAREAIRVGKALLFLILRRG
jgi:hypothetical protein